MKTFCLITDSEGYWRMDYSPVPMRHKRVKEIRELFVQGIGIATFMCSYEGNMVNIRVSDLQINELGYITGDVEYIWAYRKGDVAMAEVVKDSCGVII